MQSLTLLGGDLDHALERLCTEPAVWVTVAEVQGSVPREVGAWMAVFPSDAMGTIGGGRLEWDAEQQARRLLSDPSSMPLRQRYALGPSLGQCCGGVAHLDFRYVQSSDIADLRARLQPTHQPVALFGGGHVGHALVQALSPLPFQVQWIDSRDSIFPSELPARIQVEHSDPVEQAVPQLPTGSQVLIMSFSHAEDLAIVAACLDRQRQFFDLPFIGLIGSRTKWATFRHRLSARGYADAELDQVTCPIGLPGLIGKEPAVIAASIAAQLLLGRSLSDEKSARGTIIA